MAVLIGTDDGVYRASGVPFDDAERVLDCGAVAQVRAFDAGDAFAATRTGLYRSTDGGDSWEGLDLPHAAVWSVLAADGALYAGTAPAHLYRSTDRGASWREVETLQNQPSRDRWTSPVDDDARLRTLGAHPEDPDLLIAGVEAGRLHVSTDGGGTWTEHGGPIPDDVHHVLVRGPEEFVVSTGFLGLDGRAPGGLYRTTDAGASWTRLDAGVERAYFREAIDHGGRLYSAAARNSPGAWRGEDGPDAALYESDADGGALAAVPYPGAPDEVVIAWAVHGGRVLAGTAAGPEESVLVRVDGGWRRAGRVPADVRSLASI